MNQDIFADTPLKKYGKETVLDFIQGKIKNNDNFEEILKKTENVEQSITTGDITMTRSSRGFYYERLWDLCVKFGVTNLTLPSVGRNENVTLQTSHIINENTNISEDIVFHKNCWQGNKLNQMPGGYLNQTVRSGNSGCYSDITFINKTQDDKGHALEELCFVSVKYFEREKDISEYDIGKLCTLIRQHERPGRVVKLYILVNNKTNAIDKFNSQNASSNILIKYINPGGKFEHVYGSDDLHEAYFKLKQLLKRYNYFETDKDIASFQDTYLNVLKNVFIPRFHQRLFIHKIRDLIDDREKNILVGAIPRSGKSYIMAGTILDCVERQPDKKLRFLIMTPAPNETFNEYTDIFNNYIDFEKYGIDIIKHEGDVKMDSVCKNADRHCVIIISKQKLGWSSTKTDKLLNNAEHIEEIDEDENEDAKDNEIGNIKKRVTKLLGTNNNINVMQLFLIEKK